MPKVYPKFRHVPVCASREDPSPPAFTIFLVNENQDFDSSYIHTKSSSLGNTQYQSGCQISFCCLEEYKADHILRRTRIGNLSSQKNIQTTCSLLQYSECFNPLEPKNPNSVTE